MTPEQTKLIAYSRIIGFLEGMCEGLLPHVTDSAVHEKVKLRLSQIKEQMDDLDEPPKEQRE